MHMRCKWWMGEAFRQLKLFKHFLSNHHFVVCFHESDTILFDEM